MAVAPQQAPGVSGASVTPPQGESFRDRKAAQLRDERAALPPEQPTDRLDPPQERTLRHDVDSEAQDIGQDDQVAIADDEYESGVEGELYDDPEDGTLTDSADDETEENHDWKKRYEDQQAELTRLQQVQTERDEQTSAVIGEGLQLKFDLEDRLREATGRAEIMANAMSGNAQQYRNINWATIPPDQVANVQAQAQQAMVMEQQANAAWEQAKNEADEVRSQLKQREAAIAKARLSRTIGLNNEVYGQLREYAVGRGMAPQVFNDITDAAIIEDLHFAMTMRNAGSTVRTDKKRRAKPPRGRGAHNAPRDARGKFAKAEVVPNQRGSFADKHRHRLNMERQGR